MAFDEHDWLWVTTSTAGGGVQGSAACVVRVTHCSRGSGGPGVKQESDCSGL